MASVESISGILLKKDSTNNYSNLQVAVQVATENDELNADADADADAEANISADAEICQIVTTEFPQFRRWVSIYKTNHYMFFILSYLYKC